MYTSFTDREDVFLWSGKKGDLLWIAAPVRSFVYWVLDALSHQRSTILSRKGSVVAGRGFSGYVSCWLSDFSVMQCVLATGLEIQFVRQHKAPLDLYVKIWRFVGIYWDEAFVSRNNRLLRTAAP